MIVLMAGFPGTGKSMLARELTACVSGTVVSKEAIRQVLFAQGNVEEATEQDDFCTQIMLQSASYILARGPDRIVFLDGRTFSRGYQVDRVLRAAKELNQPWRILERVCSNQTARERLESQVGNHPAGNRDFAYLEVKARFEEITLPKIVIDTDLPLQTSIERALC